MSNKSLYKLILPTAMMSLLFSACNDSEEYSVSGDGSLSPLSISVNLSDGLAKTRAIDKEFEGGDKLLAYIEHVDDRSTTVNVDMSPSLVSLDVNADPSHTVIPNGKETTSLTITSVKQGSTELLPAGQTVLYWDDFSSSSKDINTTGHGLRVKYGYCLNGRVLDPAPSLNEYGNLTWSVIQDQTTAEKANYKKSDLLWCKTQESVAYSHSTTDRAGLKIPYTHAMSKVTLVLIANEGFATTAFSDTEATLLNMNISGSMHATDATITAASAGTGDDAGKVFMYKNTPSTTVIDEKTLPICTFEALVMPTKVLTNGLVIASLTDVEGNNYNITISNEILKGFNKNVDPGNPDDNTAPVTMKSGVNYKLTITLDKQPQTIVAQITDWNNVEAATTGEIKFDYDVVSHNISEGTTWTNGDQLDLWRLGYESETQDKENTAYGDKATTSTFNDSKWVNGPQIYWANGSQKYYFRALSKYEAKSESDATKVYKSVNGSTEAEQGTDLIWATTADHTGTDADGTHHTYKPGKEINPRTGTVPMAFEHAMSKISVNLQTSEAGSADAVDLAGATISIANIYDKGTIELENGNIGSFAASKDIPISGYLAKNDNSEGTKLSEVIVIPQSLKYMRDNNTERNGTMSFYSKNEITTIGDKSYLTSTLTKTYYLETEANEYNSKLDGAVKEGDPIYYTYAEFKALKNSELDADLFTRLTTEQITLTYTLEEYKALPESYPFSSVDESSYNQNPAKKAEYDTDSAKDYNATLSGAVKEGDPIYPDGSEKYTKDEADEFNAKLNGAVKKGDPIYYTYAEFKALKNSELDADLFTRLTTEQITHTYTLEEYKALPESYPFSSVEESSYNSNPAKKAKYDTDSAREHNAALTGAVKKGDFKGYQIISESKEVPAGGIKSKGENPKIVMLITLKDGTTYTLDLVKCTTTVDGQEKNVDTWVRGKHYTYTITLKKEQITFRAMVKDWVEKTGSGDATLEWD